MRDYILGAAHNISLVLGFRVYNRGLKVAKTCCMMLPLVVGKINLVRGRDDYYMLLGDLLLLVDGLPESVSDLKRVGRTWALSLVKSNEDDITSLQFKVKASQPIDFQDGMFAVFLMNIESQRRVEKKCGICSFGYDSMVSQKIDPHLLLKMNESQRTAVMAHKTLTCGPTNVAIVDLALRVLNLVRESLKTTTASGDYFCSVGDLLLFGKREILKVRIDIEEIYLEHRIERLAECLGPVTDKLRNDNEGKRSMLEIKSFIEFVQVQFKYLAPPLRRCIVTFCTHVPISFMGEYNFQNMISLLDNLSSLEYLLFQKNLVSEDLEDLFNSKPLQDDVVTQCLSLLKTLQISLEGLALPCLSNKYAIKQFCFERACAIFCTTSSSYKLHAVNMEPFNILVIDEAAQLKEAESTIPLQLPRMKHAILIGDECQLPAAVKRNVCIKSGFGRSLFERLSSLGHSMHLLNVQYRMHPSISFFPNLKFYKNKVLDAQNVLSKSYEKRHLSGPMFGSYSFINVVGGREELDDDGKSRRNMVEVAIVIKIVKFLYRAWQDSKKKLSIGVISPYAAQVISIQEKLTHKYEKLDGYSIKVRSIDGFQGGEEDIIIFSTVRSNNHGCIGFISCLQRTNVALTRARHCLWILGNEKTLSSSESIWKELVFDARNRHCFFDADADECLKTIIIAAIKELDQLDDLVNGNSVLFKHAKWKVLFSDDFRRSFAKLTGSRLKKQVLNLLLKLSSAWRPKNRSTDFCCKSSSQILKKFKVEGLYVICTNDIIKEVKYVQVLKVWDVLALDEIPKLTKRLESIFSAYTNAYISRCTEKCLEGEPFAFGKGADLPMQVTDEQMDIILSPKSSFIIGRSRTGKTTILTMKLFQYEHKFRVGSDGIYEAGNNRFRGDKVLHQLFVTVSPKLCYAVKQNVSHLTRADVIDIVSSDVNSSAEINHNDTNVITSEVNDIPDTFTNISVRNYPLVITFQKFLMMLDGTLSNSFFERFLEAREGYHGNRISSRSVALQTLIRLREVTFDRFCSLYWPRFNSSLTKKVDPSRIFTEIISHIKGGLQAGECSDGKLGYDDYCLLAESRSSALTREKREIVYTIYETYEKVKTLRGEFDLGDLVNDIHLRLKNGNYEGERWIWFILMRSKILEFLSTRTSGKKDNGFVSEISQLKQNFRTHTAVLDLAQSVIDLIYHYFIHSIDKLEPEISLISGEAPVLLESGSDENAIVTIFGDTGTSLKIAGFGADQVILVCNDGAKTEICEYVGKNALVLTILECKGLEFHDVLLYNFFGTSPLKDQWRVIYGYMKKHNLLKEKISQSFSTFDEARHSVLCSELKQLYVAITRTRQRLWICENKEELSKPMFNYWKMKGLVQVRELDDSVAQSMRVASTPQEWLDRGKKSNFVMSTLCFEKAGDTMWEKLAKASSLRASADQMRGTNHDAFETCICTNVERSMQLLNVSLYQDVIEKPRKLTPREISLPTVYSSAKKGNFLMKGWSI
ncbi:uvrD-like Helicase, ATP-binding domain, P-loop containing nucleoside triphosphate hydrolase [Artemisia annua]|uniref:UvrD-like Helicase, ATP-binding domain, P-loop containing nucleoside triphosphate hydrolase n=1 Tax=Artemisia annua TaxID=35608 RepID=A0A2U1M3C1_ARTAN|nr:uvrD-like Helicase, ATP-binding domain, P-loop containing nucleoside triphosphate hydrolase [Artemisia annua]